MLGEGLRRARERAEMTQERLSLESGISRQYISDLEHDKKSPTVETLLRLYEAMGASAGDMIRRLEREWRKA